MKITFSPTASQLNLILGRMMKIMMMMMMMMMSMWI
jgi:hypothetical protein